MTSLWCHVDINPFHAAHDARISRWEHPNLQNSVWEDRVKKGLSPRSTLAQQFKLLMAEE